MKSREELLQSITDLGTVTDDAERRARLLTLSDEVTALYDSHDTLTTSNEKFKKDNEELKDYNMKLFLRVGEQNAPKPTEPPKTNETLSYEKLFNEKGDLI